MSNGELVKKIGTLMEKKKMSVSAYRELMLEATASSLTKQDDMDDKLKSVCVKVEIHDDAIKTLRKRDNINNIVTGVLASIATIVGIDK